MVTDTGEPAKIRVWEDRSRRDGGGGERMYRQIAKGQRTGLVQIPLGFDRPSLRLDTLPKKGNNF